MPAFIKPTAAGLIDFNVRLAVTELAGVPTVDIQFNLATIDATGAPIGRFAGDLRPELTGPQQAQLEALAATLYNRAKDALLS